MVTDYIETTGKCLHLHYEWLTYGSLYVYLIGEDRQLELITMVSSDQPGELISQWELLVAKLPASKNLKQIIIMGNRTTNTISGIALDDISIRPCSNFGNYVIIRNTHTHARLHMSKIFKT